MENQNEEVKMKGRVISNEEAARMMAVAMNHAIEKWDGKDMDQLKSFMDQAEKFVMGAIIEANEGRVIQNGQIEAQVSAVKMTSRRLVEVFQEKANAEGEEIPAEFFEIVDKAEQEVITAIEATKPEAVVDDSK